MKRKFITLSALALLLGSCGITKNAADANKNSACIKEMNAEMILKMGPSAAEEKRNKKAELLGLNMNDMGNKLFDAAVYMKAMAHQLKSSKECIQTENGLEIEYLNAAKEFSRKISGLAKKANEAEIKISNIVSDKTADDLGIEADVLEAQRNLVAYAATMHEIHDFQLNQRNKKKSSRFSPSTHESLSMMDLIQQSLIAERDVEAGKINLSNIKDYQLELADSSNKQIMLQLINLRYNFLTALASKFLVDPNSETFQTNAHSIQVSLKKGEAPTTKLPSIIDGVNSISRAKISKYLSNAAKAKSFLIELGTLDHLSLDPELQFILTFIHIDSDSTVLSGVKTSKVANDNAQKTEIKELISEILEPIVTISEEAPAVEEAPVIEEEIIEENI